MDGQMHGLNDDPVSGDGGMSWLLKKRLGLGHWRTAESLRAVGDAVRVTVILARGECGHFQRTFSWHPVVHPRSFALHGRGTWAPEGAERRASYLAGEGLGADCDGRPAGPLVMLSSW